MKDDVVLISTHHLPRAGALRDAFSAPATAPTCVTPDEEITRDGAVLLVLTGGWAGGGGPLAPGPGRAEHPGLRHRFGRDASARARARGFDEVFTASTTAADVAAVGRSAIERRRLQRITGIVGETDAMREVLERVVQIAPVASTVLVTGESGTGKELVARGHPRPLAPPAQGVHRRERRRALGDAPGERVLRAREGRLHRAPWTPGAASSSSPTAARSSSTRSARCPWPHRPSSCASWSSGSSIASGARSPIQVDVRIVAATNQDLRQLVAIGEFRRDLYFRLNVLHISLPAAAGAAGRHPPAGRAFVQDASERLDRPFAGHLPRGHGDPPELRLARKRARAART